MRRSAVLAVVVVCAVGAASCSTGSGGDGRPAVVAGFAPLAEVARRVGGDRVSVRDLTPPGAEPHDLELPPDAVAAVADAALAVVVGGGFQPAVEEAAARRRGPTVRAVRPGDRDPHVWLDPTRMARLAGQVAGELARLDPEGAGGYRDRAATYRRELAALDREYAAGLARCERRVIVVTHDAFGALARRYDLRQESLAGISPEAEPDPARLDELVRLVRREGVTTVFTEPHVSPRLARALAREAGVRTAVLDPIEILQPKADYASVMRRNLAALRAALGCR
jgi:zinc transport system substrate-binding protein